MIEPGRVTNDICSLQDFIPTFAAANGEPDLVEKVKKGCAMGGKTYKVHLDGVNLLPFLSGKEDKSPRDGFIYWSDDGECMAVRMGRFKVVFAEQRKTGLDVWREPLSPMRIPKFFDLRADPLSVARRASSTMIGSSLRPPACCRAPSTSRCSRPSSP